MRLWIPFLSFFLLLVAALLISGASTPEAHAQGIGRNEVVMMYCAIWSVQGDPNIGIVVHFAESSGGAPVVPTGTTTNCAQELSNLFAAGMEIAHVSGSDWGDATMYTLMSRWRRR